ncbi:hypothetical protein JYU34_020623 [Plutella xylostella]|uniref:Gloverin n=1 Tax=Plutella xylostella TaxID=51655 RepID=A0ABQ7PUT1_PLUXY|nr:hypothetical protein JYU34_020623 [Plutella xylostella]
MYRFAVILSVFAACAVAQVSLPPGYADKYPDFYKYSKLVRHPRQVTWDKNVGRGKVFGTLGGTDDSLYGKAGYRQDIFNDHRGRLQGEASGTRVLSPYGDSSHLGGRLDYSNKHANANLDVSKRIGGVTSWQAEGKARWPIGKNSELSAGGMIRQDHLGHGRPDYGVVGGFKSRF